MRVLLVSQDPEEMSRCRSALRLLGAVEVVEESSEAGARERLLTESFSADCLVIDGDLRPRGGFAVVYDLQARAQLRSVAAPPSVVLTARVQDEWLAAWAGASQVLMKPIDPFALVDAVRRATRGRVPLVLGPVDHESAQEAHA